MCTGVHPYIPVPDTMEARLQFSTPGGQAENVFNFFRDEGIDEAIMLALAQALAEWWTTEIAPGVSDQVALERIIVTDIQTETGGQVTYTTDLPANGTNTSLPLPMNVAAVISWKTGARGRSYRGRTYHLGLCINATDASELSPTARADLQDQYGTLLDTSYVDPDAELAVVSRCQDNAWLTTAIVTPITSCYVDLPLDSQRRRLPGRGA